MKEAERIKIANVEDGSVITADPSSLEKPLKAQKESVPEEIMEKLNKVTIK